MEKEINKTTINQIIRRRKKSFTTIFFLIFLAAFVAAIALPPIYKSEALIRIDDQEIPEGIVQPTMPDFVEQRIGKIKQKVLSRPRLEEIAEDLNLYSKGNNHIEVSEVIEKFRENIHMETIVSEMQSKPGGKTLSFTLAFNLSYEGKDPETVQKVTDKLANLYIEEDIKRKENVMSATNDFLKAELERLKVDIDYQEKKISEFKKKHLRELPSEVRTNIQMIARLEREADKANMQLRGLNEKKLYLESELANIEPLSPIVIEGDRISTNPNQRLKELNIQLTKMKSIYSEKHPDIKKIKREIKQLETQVQSSDSTVEKIKMLRHMENELASLESELGPKHPDVIELKKKIAVLSKEVNNLMTESVKMKISEEKPDNPVYINLMTQINATNVEIQAVKEDEQNIIQSIEEYQRRIEKAPNIEQELNSLTRDYEASKDKYQEILNELMSTQVARNVEGMQRGQRFIIASPAYLPTKPFKPNRLVILLVGFIIAIGTSFIIAAFQESMDDTIKTADELRQLTSAPVLASISYITTDREKNARKLKRAIWFFIIIVCVGSCLYIANKYVIKLDYLWSTILERIKMIV
jgi:uncharacterized protein involved in exopolysaccharide biosynthesis